MPSTCCGPEHVLNIIESSSPQPCNAQDRPARSQVGWRVGAAGSERARTRKAPSASDRPAIWVSTLVPSTTSSVSAANTSALPMSAMRR